MPEQYRANKWTAIERGANTFEGRPCRNCGGAARYVSSGGCVACAERNHAERYRRRARLAGRTVKRRPTAELKRYAVEQHLEGKRSQQSIANEIGYSRAAVTVWAAKDAGMKRLREEAASLSKPLSRTELQQQLRNIAIFKSNGQVNGNRSRFFWFRNHGLTNLWNELLRHTAFLPRGAATQERHYCIFNDITERPRCQAPGCNKFVKFRSSRKRDTHYIKPGYNRTCSPQHSGVIRGLTIRGVNHPNWKGDEHEFSSQGYHFVTDPMRPLMRSTSRKGKRFRQEHLVMLETLLERRVNSENVHHINDNKSDNLTTNFFVCTAPRHRQIEYAMQSLGKQLLFSGKALLTKEEKYELLAPFKRLHGMFVQQELYDKWIAEGRIKDWSKGPKADWER